MANFDKMPRMLSPSRRWHRRPAHIPRANPPCSGSFGQPNAPAQCTAMSKRTHERCKDPALKGSSTQKCHMHGGRESLGPNMDGLKNGRYSKYLPSDLDKLYQDARTNPELIEMVEHIALLESRIKQVLGQASSGDPVPQWSDVREAFDKLVTEVLCGDQNRVNESIDSMYTLISTGQKWDTTWSQVVSTMEQLRKMTDTEVKRKKELHQMIPVERVIVLMMAVGTAVKRHVKDPNQIEAVMRELAFLHGDNRVPGKLSQMRVPVEVIHDRNLVIDVKAKKRGKKVKEKSWVEEELETISGTPTT